MEKKNWSFQYEVYDHIDELEPADKELLLQAVDATGLAYAPYSNFYVGAAARLINGVIVRGSNQENASFPVGICAERVLLSAISSTHPQTAVDTIAISYKSEHHPGNYPVSPCGICRQSLSEFEDRHKSPLRLILAGTSGQIFILSSASILLPLAFTSKELERKI